MIKKLQKFFVALVITVFFILTPEKIPAQTSFRFGSIADSHSEISNFTQTINQLKTLNPNFILFNGDVENDGVSETEMDAMMNVLDSLLNSTFIVRGNHDGKVSGSSAIWQNYFSGKYGTARPLPAGASDYSGLDANSSYLTYSFIFGNSMFIGLDSNQYGDPPNNTQLTFLDQRLTQAESMGLTHAYIFTHPPEYCVESTHCGCENTTGCGPDSQFIAVINKHPIVSATFHGHEHILSWTHLNKARVPGLTHEYEEFITSSAGNPYGFTPYPNRMDWYNYSNREKAFATVDVSDTNFTVSMYHTGSTNPLWSRTFTKPGLPTVTTAASPVPSQTPTQTSSPSVPAMTPNASLTRPLKYYAVDRVGNNTDYAQLSSWGINTAVVSLYTDDTSANWDKAVNAASAAGINIVIWPSAHWGSDVNGCRWDTPFDDGTTGGDMLKAVRPMLDRLGSKPNVIGIVNAHEAVWTSSSAQDRCSATVTDMTTIKNQIHDYIDNTVHRNTSYPPFKVWNYIDNIYNMPNLNDYSSSDRKTQIQGIMDVAVLWQHCAGYPTNQGDGSACEGTSKYTALGGINDDRNTIKNLGLEGIVEEVFLIQTFSQGTSGNYAGKFTLDELKKYSCDFLNTSALDGFVYYTWDEGWYTGNLKKWTDLWPAVSYVNNNCVNKPVIPSSTNVPPSSPVIKQGDADGDGKVDGVDYIIWLNHYRQTTANGSSEGDFNGDGKTDGMDYVIWFNNTDL